MASETDEPRNEPGWYTIAAMLGGLALVTCLCVYGLWAFWPSQAALKHGSKPVHFFGYSRPVSADGLLFVMVVFAGALGGLLHAMRSFAWYVGNRGLKWSWLPWNFLMPVLGAGVATVVYLIFRGGLTTGPAATEAVNPYFFAAVSALVGIFTEQAMEMLKNVAAQVFHDAPKGADTVDSGDTPGPESESGDTEEPESESGTESPSTEESAPAP